MIPGYSEPMQDWDWRIREAAKQDSERPRLRDRIGKFPDNRNIDTHLKKGVFGGGP